MHTKFLVEDLGIDGRIILEWILEKLCRIFKAADWIHVALNGVMGQWWAFVSTIMNLPVP
jgi:hypothetical protein